jgi:Tol biopolymer transport system component
VGARPWDADARATTILIGSVAGIDALNVATGSRSPFIQAPPETRLSEASFSPDGHWVLFRVETNTTSRVFAVPASGGAWLPITYNGINAGNPRFSPDGRVIYFTVERAGEREIDALRFDPRRGAVAGGPFTVFRVSAARLSLTYVNPQVLNIALARDKLATIVCERTATIWIGELVPH